MIYFLVIQVLAASVALIEIYGSRFGLDSWRDSYLGHLYSYVVHIGLLFWTMKHKFLFVYKFAFSLSFNYGSERCAILFLRVYLKLECA